MFIRSYSRCLMHLESFYPCMRKRTILNCSFKVRKMTNKKQFKTIDEYIGTFPENVESILEKVRKTIQKTAPEAVETIGYGIPSFNLNGRNLVYFAAWKHHISLYPIPSGDEAFQKELSQSVSGKGTTRFPFDKPIPYDLVIKIVKFLMKENLE